MKPYFAFQWHITDTCDQRCKHCYIFAENNCKYIPKPAGIAAGGRLYVSDAKCGARMCMYIFYIYVHTVFIKSTGGMICEG